MGESTGDRTRLERASHTVRGDRSELHLDDGSVTISKESATQAGPTEVTFDVDQVRSATLRRPSNGAPGWLHIAVIDGSPAPPSELAAAGDPYTLPLTPRGLADARKMSRMISDHVQRRGLPSVGTSQGTSSSSSVIVTSQPAEPREQPPVAQDRASRGVPEPALRVPEPAPGVPDRSPDPEPSAQAPAGEDHSELPDQLRQLADLHRAGALTDQEFDRAKQRLLAG